jgi:glyoxylase I family protein
MLAPPAAEGAGVSETRIDRIDHLYVTVRDLARSQAFYDPVLEALGFRKRVVPIDGDPHVLYFNAQMQYTLRPARTDGEADAYRPGALHHLCFQVADARAVDDAHARLRALGIEASAPRLYPEYRHDYYATFFRDPDGIRLEIVCDSALRRLLRRHWNELAVFENPIQDLLQRRPELAHATDPSALVRGNLFEACDPPPTGERFETLAHIGGVRVERIVSSRRPDSAEYDQDHDEWVLLVRGRARLEIAGENVELAPGDHVLLPAHRKHRVLETSSDALWLALHLP